MGKPDTNAKTMRIRVGMASTSSLTSVFIAHACLCAWQSSANEGEPAPSPSGAKQDAPEKCRWMVPGWGSCSLSSHPLSPYGSRYYYMELFKHLLRLWALTGHGDRRQELGRKADKSPEYSKSHTSSITAETRAARGARHSRCAAHRRSHQINGFIALIWPNPIQGQ